MMKTTEWKEYKVMGWSYRIRAKYGIDYSFGRQHNAPHFSITGEIDYRSSTRSAWREDSGGCIHDQIAKHFPELEPLIKWHLVSTEGPMHYEANGIWWWEHAEAIRTFQHPYEWEKYGSPRAAALHHFESTVVAHVRLVGHLGIYDSALNIMPREGTSPIKVREWLRARLPALMVAFTGAMRAAGVLEEEGR